MFYICLNVEEKSNKVWFLDSGCSNYMTGDKDIFIKFDISYKSRVIFGDGKVESVEGKGIIFVVLKFGN